LLADSPNTGPFVMNVQGFANDTIGTNAPLMIGTIAIHFDGDPSAANVAFSAIGVGDGPGSDVAAFSIGYAAGKTGTDGQFHINTLPVGNYALSANRATTDAGAAINSADALAALRIAVGTNPNLDPDGAGPLQALKLSPYQLIAADANEDGRVNSADALAILRMAVQSPTALAKEWFFVDERLDLWDEANNTSSLNRNATSWANPTTKALAVGSTPNFVAVFKGDVNGSWVPAGGAQNQDLDVTNPGYFTQLAQTLGVPTDVWGL
jgi:hypothetical protein